MNFLGDGNCVKSAFSNQCFVIHEDSIKKRLILIHEMPATISQIMNEFGMTKLYHESVISYETEVIRGFVYKIIDDIDPDAKFYFTVILIIHSSSTYL